MAARFWINGNGDWNTTNTANWSSSSGGASGASVPTSADDVTFDLHSNEATDAAYTCTLPLVAVSCKSLDVSFTGTTKVTIAGGYPLSLLGNLNLSGGTAQITWSYTGSIYFYNNATITTNGVTLNSNITIYSPSKTLTLGSDLTTTKQIGLYYNGDILDVSASNYEIIASNIYFNYSTDTLTLGSGTHTLTGIGTVFDNSAGATVTSTGTIKITSTTNNAIYFNGGNKTYNNIWFSRGTSTATNYITGSNTFADFKDDGTEAHTIAFTDGTDQTITSLTVNGSAGKLITLTGTSSAGWRISDTTGTNTVTYCNIAYSTAEGGATWKSLLDTNVNGGNNTGWVFYDPFTNPGNIYASDNVYATLPATSGILTVEISKDAGVNWLVAKTVTFTSTDTLQTCGTGSTELWGSSFTRADMVDAKLYIRLTHGGYRQVYKTFGFATGTDILTGIEVAIEGKYGSPTMSLDLLEVKIYYGTSTLIVQAGSQAFDSTNGTLAVYDGANWKDLAPLASPTFTGTVVLPSTTSIGTVSATEIGYVDGVTSAIQTQFSNKQPLATVLTNTTASYTTTLDTKMTGIATGATANAKITGATLDTLTDDTGFVTALAIQNGHNVPHAVPSTSGNLLQSNGTDWLAVAIPTWNQNTSGTASNVSGTPALPNGTTSTTQSANNNSTKLATTAYVDGHLPYGAKAYRNTSVQSVNNGTTKIQLNGESWDLSGEYDPTTNFRYTATTAGYYLVTFAANFVATESGKFYDAFVVLNGGSSIAESSMHSSITSELTLNGAGMTYLSVGGYLELNVYHNSATAKDIGNSEGKTYMTIKRLY